MPIAQHIPLAGSEGGNIVNLTILMHIFNSQIEMGFLLVMLAVIVAEEHVASFQEYFH